MEEAIENKEVWEKLIDHASRNERPNFTQYQLYLLISKVPWHAYLRLAMVLEEKFNIQPLRIEDWDMMIASVRASNKPNFTQCQLYFQSMGAPPIAFQRLLEVMQEKFNLESICSGEWEEVIKDADGKQKPNYTQYQLYFQSIEAPMDAYKRLLEIMETKLSLPSIAVQ